jgi:glycosyltransferase involved in cell wall biosynthesis
MTPTPTASILVPTRDRPEYLDVALASVAPQALSAGAELIVVDDGRDGRTRSVAERHGARFLSAPAPGGLNAARNAGIAGATADLIILIDDDIRAPEGWLAAVLRGASAAPDHDVFGGPIDAVLEGGGPRSCGREGAPITALDLGATDRDAELIWGANMALRRRAWTNVGPFDESLSGPGDEEEWERRYRATGGKIRYLAAARLDHRRTVQDARLHRLARAAFRQGRGARRFDVRRGRPPGLATELRVLIGCAAHVVRYRCANMIVIGAHALGRLRETIAERSR